MQCWWTCKMGLLLRYYFKPQNINHRFVVCHSNSTLRFIWKQVIVGQCLLQYYLQYPKGRNTPIATNKWINKMWYIHWMEYFVVVQSLNCVWFFVTPWTAAPQFSLPFTIYQSLLWLISIESVTPSNHLVLCHPLLLLLSIFPDIRVFSNELALLIRWPKWWFSISPFNEYSGLISFRTDWFDLLANQGILKSLFQHHSSKA